MWRIDHACVSTISTRLGGRFALFQCVPEWAGRNRDDTSLRDKTRKLWRFTPAIRCRHVFNLQRTFP